MFNVAYPLGFEDEPDNDDSHASNELIGCILWLKAVQFAEQYRRYGLKDQACNHPCLVLDVNFTNDEEELRLTICIITSFKRKTHDERALAVSRMGSLLIPIFPNETATAPFTTPFAIAELQPGLRMKRDSWIQTASSYQVPMRYLEKYDRYHSLQHFKLTPGSIETIRSRLALPPTYKRLEVALEQNLLHTSPPTPSSSNVNTIQLARHAIFTQSRSRQENASQPQLTSHARRAQYGTYVSFDSHAFDRARQSSARGLSYTGRPAKGRWWLKGNFDEESVLSPYTQRVQIHRQTSSWLPSRETVKTILIVTIILAATGGAGYGGYLLLRALYAILAGFCHGVAAIVSKRLARVSGAWKWCVNLVRGIGYGAVKVEKVVLRAVAKVVAAVKALLGRL